MEIKTIQQIKDEVAVKHEFADWDEVIYDFRLELIPETVLNKYIDEAMQLYTKQITEAACKEQRAVCAASIPPGAIYREYIPETRQGVLNATQPNINSIIK